MVLRPDPKHLGGAQPTPAKSAPAPAPAAKPAPVPVPKSAPVAAKPVPAPAATKPAPTPVKAPAPVPAKTVSDNPGVRCDKCYGSGKMKEGIPPKHKWVPCQTCNGVGKRFRKSGQ